ncbi:MAG: hypothetical protein HY934_01405 [Candidatus Firestonebacteria bacterium]|nr:hypothetical protein [Candidatus Firestonebacteria bacterium]
MIKNKLVLFIFFIYFISFGLIKNGHACLGKTLTIGYKNFAEQKILAEVLYVIITERTGTTVVLKSFNSTKECYEALMKGEINLYVEYIGATYSEILHKDNLQTESEKEKILELIKDNYSQKKNLIVLNAFGFESIAPENEYLRKKRLPLTATPIIGKETLNMFPILPSLLNKLGGKIDTPSIKALIKLVEKDNMNPRTAVQNFLKIKKLI